MIRNLSTMDALDLVAEVKRHASVAARFVSRSELAAAAGDERAARDWSYSAGRHEDAFLAEVDEVRRRQAGVPNAELESALALYGASDLVAVPVGGQR